jgi:hypothetical protein
LHPRFFSPADCIFGAQLNDAAHSVTAEFDGGNNCDFFLHNGQKFGKKILDEFQKTAAIGKRKPPPVPANCNQSHILILESRTPGSSSVKKDGGGSCSFPDFGSLHN